MARQLITAQPATIGGKQPVYSVPTVDGFMFQAGDGLELFVKNGNAATCNVTFPVPRTVIATAAPSHVVAVPAGQERRIAIDSNLMRRPEGGTDAGMVYVDFSVQTSVNVALQSR